MQDVKLEDTENDTKDKQTSESQNGASHNGEVQPAALRNWEYPIPTLTVLLQPEEKEIIIPRHKAKTVKRLFVTLGIRECTALVVRDGQLLTPDRKLNNNDKLLVRKVTSSG